MAHDTFIDRPQIDTPARSSVGTRALGELWRVWVILLLVGLAAFGTALALGLLLPRAIVTNDADLRRVPDDVLFDPIDFTFGLVPAETLPDGTTFNRTLGQAFFTYPYQANQGRYVHVSARLASDPVAGRQPLQGALLVNGQQVAQFNAQTEFAVVEARVDTRQTPNGYLDPAHVQVEIRSETRPDTNGNNMGVAIDWIRLESERGTGDIVREAAVWAVILMLVSMLAAFRIGARKAYLVAAGTLATMLIVRLTYLPRDIPAWAEIALVGLAWGLTVWFAPRTGKRAWLWALPLVVGLVWLLVAGRIMGDWQMDDAYISYRYAWNMAHGHGLVYNPGEVVEGYTNFLWTVLSAGVIALGLHPAGPMLALNIALAMGVVALSWALARHLTGSYFWANVAALLLCVDGALVVYGARGSGMEAVLFGFCNILAVTLLWNDAGKHIALWRILGGVSLALGALTRPEGLLVAVVLLGVKLWQDYAAGRASGATLAKWRAWAGPGITSIGAFLAIVVPYEAWRILFYGWLFPNTFYAKTGATLTLVERGLVYTGYFVAERWYVIAMAVVGGIMLLGGRRLARHGVVPAVALLLIIWTGYVLWAGGDYFPGWRFYVPVLAPLVLVAVWATHKLVSRLWGLGKVGMAAMVIVACIVALYSWRALWQQESESVIAQYTKMHTSYVNLWGSAGLWLRDNTPPESVTAAEGAGAIAYYSRRKVIDMYGLNDLHIGHLPVENMGAGKAGHEKRDPEYVLNIHRPDYIYALWAHYFEPVADQLDHDYDKAIYRSPTGPKIVWLERRD